MEEREGKLVEFNNDCLQVNKVEPTDLMELKRASGGRWGCQQKGVPKNVLTAAALWCPGVQGLLANNWPKRLVASALLCHGDWIG